MATLATLPKPVTDYQRLSPEELFERTTAAKTTLGDRVMVLGITTSVMKSSSMQSFAGIPSCCLKSRRNGPTDRTWCSVAFTSWRKRPTCSAGPNRP